MFPGFMSMIAVYYILKAVSLTNTLVALILVYSGGAGLGFYVAKGFFDAVPKEMDEAAMIDGATRSQIFWRITVPLSKPVIVYTILTSFPCPVGRLHLCEHDHGPDCLQELHGRPRICFA